MWTIFLDIFSLSHILHFDSNFRYFCSIRSSWQWLGFSASDSSAPNGRKAIRRTYSTEGHWCIHATSGFIELVVYWTNNLFMAIMSYIMKCYQTLVTSGFLSHLTKRLIVYIYIYIYIYIGIIPPKPLLGGHMHTAERARTIAHFPGKLPLGKIFAHVLCQLIYENSVARNRCPRQWYCRMQRPHIRHYENASHSGNSTNC